MSGRHDHQHQPGRANHDHDHDHGNAVEPGQHGHDHGHGHPHRGGPIGALRHLSCPTRMTPPTRSMTPWRRVDRA